MEPDWDLQAVVRSFGAFNKSENTVASDFKTDAEHPRTSGTEESDKTVVTKTENNNIPMYLIDPGQTQTQSVQPTISSYLAALQAYRKRTQQEHKGSYLYGTRTSSASSADTPKTINKPKRRKNQQKKICHVPAEELSSDVWSWRKYGQKPIKGSPYPRSYYKCSSSKACLARKQVERNRSDPNMFIVTYTAEHNHPAPTHKNSLAGTTRNQNSQGIPSATANEESSLLASKPSSDNSAATMSPGGSLDDEVLQQSTEMESMEVDTGGDINRADLDDVMEFLDMDITDNFFGDLDEFSGPQMECFFPDELLPNFPWIANNGSSTDDTNWKPSNC